MQSKIDPAQGRGFAFCTYKDATTAKAAINNCLVFL
jgi:hypothetical protein